VIATPAIGSVPWSFLSTLYLQNLYLLPYRLWNPIHRSTRDFLTKIAYVFLVCTISLKFLSHRNFKNFTKNTGDNRRFLTACYFILRCPYLTLHRSKCFQKTLFSDACCAELRCFLRLRNLSLQPYRTNNRLIFTKFGMNGVLLIDAPV
jgi:hypothetical protein